MHETTEQTVGSFRIEVLGDEDRYDEGVDGDDTGHDNGNEALGTKVVSCQLRPISQHGSHIIGCRASGDLANLHNEVWPECSHSCDTDTGFGRAIGCSGTAKDHGSRDSALFNGQRCLAASLKLGDVVRIARTMPMKGANLGANSESDMIVIDRVSEGISFEADAVCPAAGMIGNRFNVWQSAWREVEAD